MRKLFLFLLFLSVTFSYAQKKKNYNIGILLDNATTELEPLLQKLKTQIKTVVGEDATIAFPTNSLLVNDYNLENAKQNYNTLLNNSTDIILAFGVVNSKIIEAQTAYKKPTILFGAINKDFNSIDVTKVTSGVKNFTYLINSQSYLDDLKKLKQLTDFKKVGIVVEAPFANLLPLKETFDRELKEVGATYKLIPFKTVNDITSNLDDIDAVYIAGGFFLTENETKQIANALIDKKLPSFTINSINDVENGIMATNQSEDNSDQFFRRVSLTIESYINGTPLADMPVYIEFSPRLTINFNTVSAIGIPIKYSLLNDTDFVGEFNDINAERNYNLLSVMKQVLGDNLTLQATKKNIDLSEQKVKTAKSNYLPNLTATATGTYIDPKIASNGNPEFSTGGNVTLQQTIFSPAASANITIQKNLKKAEEENYNAEQLNTIFNASNAYFNALILKTNVQIRMRNLDLTKKNLQIAKENFEAGQSDKSDVLRFRSELAQNTQAMIQAINQLEQGFIGLNQLLNNPLEMRIEIDDAELDKGLYKDYKYTQLTELLDNSTTREPFISFLVEEAKKNAPELKSLDYNLKATERNIKLSGSNRFLPTVALQGQYNRTFNRSGVGSTLPGGASFINGNYNAGINLTIPIFNQNQNNINKQTAIIQKDQIEVNRQNSELNIAANVRNGVLNLVNQISNIELSKVSEETAKESLELIQSSYQEGAVTFVQLIDAQNNYLNAQLAKANAVYNFLINAVQLERNIGYYFLLHTKAENEDFTQRFQNYLLNKQ
ncbi:MULTISPECIES: TolC family protein [unclassified Tenacibaculum]|uniref:TolC family protein n=1 Tax=unclassified Tenacibaculum TaxID=2635139 RepID=UPI001F3351BD|nr:MULTISPECIES: TolC family protein [unclassified Tenacibaculum]MCF2874723.1 TolC family protein [Tenacibaculum sp. Cn5-1]MCF2934211.1 TolC family protein [Tenacibaculum sp. Cn5-34]MCG7510421.1 TolC family protein [Tenacibaculum sp. Cn5-46]